jgi:hypothetical protein
LTGDISLSPFRYLATAHGGLQELLEVQWDGKVTMEDESGEIWNGAVGIDPEFAWMY